MDSLIIFMLICSFTPGPGNILALKTTTIYGFKKSIRLLLGICLGYLIVQTICTIFLYQLNNISDIFLKIFSVIGSLYMLYLAYHIIKDKPNLSIKEKNPTLRDGLLLQLINIKIFFYIISLLSKYFIPLSNNTIELILYGLFAVTIGSIASLIWAFCGCFIQRYYMKYYKIINIILGLLLIYCAIKMLL